MDLSGCNERGNNRANVRASQNRLHGDGENPRMDDRLLHLRLVDGSQAIKARTP